MGDCAHRRGRGSGGPLVEDIWDGGTSTSFAGESSRYTASLKPTGSLYFHCDWHASHYIKVMLDDFPTQSQCRMPQYKRYRDELKGKPVPDLWTNNPVGSERVGYLTQKPEALLERIIAATRNPETSRPTGCTR